MYLSAHEQQGLRGIFALLAEDLGEREIRERLGWALLDLLRADQFASYVWDADRGCFGARVALNMDPANLDRYGEWHQHHDPITFQLQAQRRATRVTELMPQRELMRTPFFNDFLARDGLHWGMNLHAFDGDRALGDLRIWRRRGRGDFGAHHTQMLSLIEPAFAGALRQARRRTPAPVGDAARWRLLSERERQVALAVREGLTDKQIARRLALGPPTVRTYLRRIFEKLGIERRAALAALAPPDAA